MATATKKLIEAELRKGPKSVADLVKLVGVSRVSTARALRKMEDDGKAYITAYYKPLIGSCVPLWAFGGRPSAPPPAKLSDDTKRENDRISKQFNKLGKMMERKARLQREIQLLETRIMDVQSAHENMRKRAAKEQGLNI